MTEPLGNRVAKIEFDIVKEKATDDEILDSETMLKRVSNVAMEYAGHLESDLDCLHVVDAMLSTHLQCIWQLKAGVPRDEWVLDLLPVAADAG